MAVANVGSKLSTPISMRASSQQSPVHSQLRLGLTSAGSDDGGVISATPSPKGTPTPVRPSHRADSFGPEEPGVAALTAVEDVSSALAQVRARGGGGVQFKLQTEPGSQPAGSMHAANAMELAIKNAQRGGGPREGQARLGCKSFPSSLNRAWGCLLHLAYSMGLFAPHDVYCPDTCWGEGQHESAHVHQHYAAAFCISTSMHQHSAAAFCICLLHLEYSMGLFAPHDVYCPDTCWGGGGAGSVLS